MFSFNGIYGYNRSYCCSEKDVKENEMKLKNETINVPMK